MPTNELYHTWNRRDLYIFQIGLRFIDRCLVNQYPFSKLLCS